ncbi:MAG: hypothetical protein CME63_17320 [Halobacteriovoraceae bacterium]|nr:hypothetical protein [Halobacteriovoraceae bacterium]|tara:strand:+ start:202082 stop:203698 length:1617 start_codon:yes stop_codon:yes gene_type:complete
MRSRFLIFALFSFFSSFSGPWLAKSSQSHIKLNSKHFTRFYQLYKVGEYQQAIDELLSIAKDNRIEAERNYLIGLCLKSLQRHDEAVVFFKRSISQGYRNVDLFYEYAQSLYAINELRLAKKAFQITYDKGYKTDVSLYYIAYISELLEDKESVKKNYLKIIKDDRSTVDMKQLAYFKLGELIYENIKDKLYVQNYIEDYVSPLLRRSIELDDDSTLSEEVRAKYDEILLKHGMHPLLLMNGKMLSRKNTTLTFTQDIAFDSNVNQESDSPTQTNENTGDSSLIMNSELFLSKRFLGFRRFVFSPEIRVRNENYLNDNNPAVFQNDGYTIAPALRGAYEFNWNKKISSLLYEYEYTYTARDKNAVGKKDFFGATETYILGLRYRFIPQGETTIKIKLRELKSFSELISGSTRSLYLDQMYIRSNGHVIIGMMQADLYRPNEEFYATDSLFLRADYLIPRLVWNMDLNLNISLNLLDTKAQSETRGVEKTFSFGAKMLKRIKQHWRVGVFGDFMRNMSKDDANYSFSKLYMGAEVRYSF